jgi:hypothetical protein
VLPFIEVKAIRKGLIAAWLHSSIPAERLFPSCIISMVPWMVLWCMMDGLSAAEGRIGRAYSVLLAEVAAMLERMRSLVLFVMIIALDISISILSSSLLLSCVGRAHLSHAPLPRRAGFRQQHARHSSTYFVLFFSLRPYNAGYLPFLPSIYSALCAAFLLSLFNSHPHPSSSRAHPLCFVTFADVTGRTPSSVTLGSLPRSPKDIMDLKKSNNMGAAKSGVVPRETIQCHPSSC